jgi:hypothetical protein
VEANSLQLDKKWLGVSEIKGDILCFFFGGRACASSESEVRRPEPFVPPKNLKEEKKNDGQGILNRVIVVEKWKTWKIIESA